MFSLCHGDSPGLPSIDVDKHYDGSPSNSNLCNGKDSRVVHIGALDSNLELDLCFRKTCIVDSSHGYLRFILEYLLVGLHVLLKVKWFVLI